RRRRVARTSRPLPALPSARGWRDASRASPASAPRPARGVPPPTSSVLRGGGSGWRTPEQFGEVVYRTVSEPCDCLVHNINAVDGLWQQPGAPLEFRRRPWVALEHDGLGVLEEAPAVPARERRR